MFGEGLLSLVSVWHLQTSNKVVESSKGELRLSRIALSLCLNGQFLCDSLLDLQQHCLAIYTFLLGICIYRTN